MINKDEIFMQRAIELAYKGSFNVSPNPRVGAVIVYNDLIIGEGFHRNHGGPHAEVNAIESVKDKSLLMDSTIYVTLEPCSHFGKTPPCSDLIIHHNIPKVIIASKDPFYKVNGSGIEKLKSNGIEVTEGVLEKEAIELNKRFFTFHQKKRPYIILKWAKTADGFISRKETDELFKTDNWITTELSKQLVHSWRAEEDGILVGTKTARLDNPELTTREIEGKNPSRLIIDRDLCLDDSLNVFNQEANTIIFNGIEDDSINNIKKIKIDFEKADALNQILKSIYEHGIQSIIVEGGAYTLKTFLNAGLWDETREFVGKKEFKGGILAPIINKDIHHHQNIDKDTLNFYFNN